MHTNTTGPITWAQREKAAKRQVRRMQRERFMREWVRPAIGGAVMVSIAWLFILLAFI